MPWLETKAPCSPHRVLKTLPVLTTQRFEGKPPSLPILSLTKRSQ